METDYDVVVIGGGAAGLSAALYSCRAMLRTVVFERLPGCGGQILLTDMIENYPGFPEGVMGQDLSLRMEEQARRFGAEIRYEEIVAIENIGDPVKTIRTQEGAYRTKTLIIATGGSHNLLNAPGEDVYSGRGVSYCAVCDGNFFRNQDVVVVGGGDAAMQEGLYLANIVRSVTVVHRRDELRASKILQERAMQNPKMKFLWSHIVEEILGDGNTVQAVRLQNLKTGKTRNLPTQGVFIYIGFHVNTDFLQGLVPQDETGHIATNIIMETEIPGVYACGDIRAHSNRQLGSAVGDGITAALSAYEYISYEEV